MKRFDDPGSLLSWLGRAPGVLVPCHTCGRYPVGVFGDGSWRYDCHIKPVVPHVPTSGPSYLELAGLHGQERHEAAFRRYLSQSSGGMWAELDALRREQEEEIA